MIRCFEMSDLDQILEMERSCFPKSPYSRSLFLHLFALYPDTFLVHEADREEFPVCRIQGYILFSGEGHLISLATHPDFRRRGIGSSLVEAAVRTLLTKPMWAEVRQSNRGALAFYRQMGFQIMGRIPAYYGNEDAWVVRLEGRKESGSPSFKFLDRDRKGG